MTAPISGNRPIMLPQSQTTSDVVAQKAVLPLALEQQSAPVEAKKRLAMPQDITAFEQMSGGSARGAMPALLGSVADNPLQKSLGKQTLINTHLEVAAKALATAQAGFELAAGIASQQFAGLRNEAAGALSGLSARMPLDIANSVAGAINSGTDLRQLDVLQGIAHTQGPLAAGNLEAGQYSADQLGQYGDQGSYGDYGGYGETVDPMSQFGGVADLAGGVADLASGVADLGDAFRKPSSKPSAPESKPSAKPSAPDAKPSAPESKPSAKPSAPESKPSAEKPSAPDAKPSSAAGKADDLAKSLLKTGGKAASRFVPGLNVAMAGLDIANAVKTIKDPNASLGDKITSGIVAGGSALAATNIPIVSQIGGAISTGASVAGEVVKNFGGAIKDGAKKVGEGIKHAAEKVGEGIKDTAEKVGKGIKDTAEKVGKGIKDFFKGW
ncbi:hypothetical protein JQX13_23120 [Archangium violaceum]|uniref:hypothetical protein n=1 Tax=Archangium violaceum TaxID=83451 RepID=UPI00193B604D|nr:hypothetical protein [Archangium violaceum]QRK12669.1 hypothetical protein JQX13_23120 [Archangium violaceum]